MGGARGLGGTGLDRRCVWACLVVLGACLVSGVTGQDSLPRSMTISAIFDEDGDEIHELAFKHAVQVVNRNRSVGVKCNQLPHRLGEGEGWAV